MARITIMLTVRKVNSNILTQSGGTCICSDQENPTCAGNTEYELCLNALRRDFITGTAAIAALSSFCMGLFANMPIALAPGSTHPSFRRKQNIKNKTKVANKATSLPVGLNAYFTYNVVGFRGTGPVPYRLALTAVFIEGFVFVGLSVCGMRQWLARAIPRSIKLASGAGIGLYLCAFNTFGFYLIFLS